MIRRLSVLLVLLSLSASASAGEYIYKSKNKLDYIKLDKAKKDEKGEGLNHPYTFEPEQMRAILSSIHFNKNQVIMQDIKDRQLFDEANVEFLTSYLIEAFKKAKPEEVVVVSYFTRNSHLVVQEDRLTIFRGYVKNDGLHLKFTKTYAKLLGDRTTMGAQQMSQQARSLGVALEPQDGQNRVSWDPEEIVFDLAYFCPGGKANVVAGLKPAPTKQEVKSNKVEKEKKTDASQSEAEKVQSIRVRLKELDQLKADEMITEKEYKKKREELLKEL